LRVIDITRMEPGACVGRFRVDREAGAGGMGRVFRATDMESGAAVALKVLHGDDRSDLERFDREVSLLASMAHPGIVRYVAHGRTESGLPYLAMEWLEGPTLSQHGRGRLASVDVSVRLVGKLAEALGAAHARGIIHRDVKPQNVILVHGDVGAPKLLDFGIARPRDGVGLTVAGAVLGTPGFMAPEQARGESDIDARVDVFGLGCLLFWCLAGRAPFAGEHLVAILTKTLFDAVPPMRTIRGDVPEAVDRALEAMLAKVAADRPADGNAVAKRCSPARRSRRPRLRRCRGSGSRR
jgi:serine/threonine protein kinase